MENEKQKQPQQDPQPEEEPKQDKEPKTFTRDQIGGIVEKQVASKMDEINANWQKKLDEAVAKAKQDGKDEATLSAKELAEKQAKEQAEAIKQQKAELDKRQAELDRRDHLAHTRDLLSEQNLPTDGAEMLLGATEEETKANIANFKQLVAQGVRNELHKSSAGKDPQGGAPAHRTPAPKKDLAEMTYDEMRKYLKSQQD